MFQFEFQLDHQLSTTIVLLRFRLGVHLIGSLSICMSIHFVVAIWKVENGRNFSASQGLITTAVQLETEYQQSWPIGEDSFKLEHKLEIMVINGRMSTLMLKPGTRLSCCNMNGTIRWGRNKKYSLQINNSIILFSEFLWNQSWWSKRLENRKYQS